ncbi:deoxyribose-phosphate aldolase [Pasteurellaceae bacterium 20609_3]|uniref:deoxyribose-phosphate aldolase n=1 Tax=Spirabiliibacterium mucosae TaxID=28156 RepID=UPI001AACF3F7|nr:deoxyribose-phosphate aldolase [Spirabiliibacterium mucosae]MBE2898477.1 deoxyribose-phosphate aldolase [Spirabiliibacterium mucosae]
MSNLQSLEQAAQLALSLMDLTSLNDDDTNETITALCHQANTPKGAPAAVCVYPQFVPLAKQTLSQLGLEQVKVATVTNFPHGNSDVAQAVAETASAVQAGADEVDVVFPYRTLMEGDEKCGFVLVQECKKVCADADVALKVIIETGELKTPELIKKAAEIAIRAGADFIKTSTGKVAVNATPEAARVMLSTIKEMGVEDRVGFKAAGGVRTSEDAQQYLQLASEILGEKWLDASHFRFGASGLLTALLRTLGVDSLSKSDNSY